MNSHSLPSPSPGAGEASHSSGSRVRPRPAPRWELTPAELAAVWAKQFSAEYRMPEAEALQHVPASHIRDYDAPVAHAAQVKLLLWLNETCEEWGPHDHGSRHSECEVCIAALESWVCGSERSRSMYRLLNIRQAKTSVGEPRL